MKFIFTLFLMLCFNSYAQVNNFSQYLDSKGYYVKTIHSDFDPDSYSTKDSIIVKVNKKQIDIYFNDILCFFKKNEKDFELKSLSVIEGEISSFYILISNAGEIEYYFDLKKNLIEVFYYLP